MQNILTIDVEDYFQVENFKGVIDFSDWEGYELRVVKNTEKILKILAEKNVKATFFVLGWVAEKFPELVRRIYEAGHEVASHGYMHELIYNQTQDEFRADLRKAKMILENITGEPILGYRAPSYSITRKSEWALDILMEEGYKYDSSLFPIHHDRGGFVNAPRFPFKMHKGHLVHGKEGIASSPSGRLRYAPLSSTAPRNDGNEMWEFPLSTVKIFGQNIPFSGGGYFRLLPYLFIKKSIEKINKEGQPAVIYIHPWELDPEQPRIKAEYMSRFRHYVNIDKTERKLIKLLNDFEFTSIRSYLETVIANRRRRRSNLRPFA